MKILCSTNLKFETYKGLFWQLRYTNTQDSLHATACRPPTLSLCVVHSSHLSAKHMPADNQNSSQFEHDNLSPQVNN